MDYPQNSYIAYHRRKELAYRMMQKEVKSGKIVRAAGLVCVDCGGTATCYDHRDYRKPLQVEPVCFGCNRSRGVAIDHPSKTQRE